MNGYDFDKTILKGNSMVNFSLFCTLRLPYLILFIPILLVAVILRGLRLITKNRYLHMISLFVAIVPNIDRFVAKYWDKNIKRIKSWYLEQRQDDDLVVSASPQFIVEEACRRLGIRCIATQLNHRTARLYGKHCYGEEKVDSYKKEFGDEPLATYYSDSMSDTPMFELAGRGYYVYKNSVVQIYENGQKLLPYTTNRQMRKYIRAQNNQ